MDFIAMAEDIRGHFRIPKARLVPEMDARFQHFPHRDRHEECPQGLGHRPAATLVRAFFSGLHYVTSRSPYELAAGSPPPLRDGDLLRPHRSPYCLRARSLCNLAEKGSKPLSICGDGSKRPFSNGATI